MATREARALQQADAAEHAEVEQQKKRAKKDTTSEKLVYDLKSN